MEYNFSKVMRRYNHLLGETEAVYHEISLKLGLSDSAMCILYTICDSGTSCLLQEICRRSGLSKQTINSAIRKLEAEGIVCLEPAGPKNKNVCLTEKGMLVADQTAGRIIKAENEIFDSWSQEEVQNYLELMEKFLVELKSKAKEI